MSRPRRSFDHIQRPVGVRGIRYRSKMEANYAAYLSWLQKVGQIRDWDYEPTTFWFTPDSHAACNLGLNGVRRGVTSYKPDFRIRSVPTPKMPGGVEWHEVKGFADSRSRTALARMARYYPHEV